MSELNLSKGQELNLSKQSNTALTKLSLGAGWDAVTEGANIDIDLSAFVLTDKELIDPDYNICYFGYKTIRNGAVKSMGDNLTGEGDGDDETINVLLDKLPEDVTDVVFVLNIYQAKYRNQHFGKVQNAFIRAYNTETGQELARTEVSEANGYDNLVFAKVSRSGSEWVFKSIQEFGNGSIRELSKMFEPVPLISSFFGSIKKLFS